VSDFRSENTTPQRPGDLEAGRAISFRARQGLSFRLGSLFDEVPINLSGFVALCLFLWWRGSCKSAFSPIVFLGAFCIWTETALLERRLGVLSTLLERKLRLDDPIPFVGALGGIAAVGFSGLVQPESRGFVAPVAMAVGAFLTGATHGLDWRRGLLGAIMVVYNGAGGVILRSAVTFFVWMVALDRWGAVTGP